MLSFWELSGVEIAPVCSVLFRHYEELSGLPEAVSEAHNGSVRLLQPHFEQNQPLRAVAFEAGIPYRTAAAELSQFSSMNSARPRLVQYLRRVNGP
jgi:hypothetical protein